MHQHYLVLVLNSGQIVHVAVDRRRWRVRCIAGDIIRSAVVFLSADTQTANRLLKLLLHSSADIFFVDFLKNFVALLQF